MRTHVRMQLVVASICFSICLAPSLTSACSVCLAGDPSYTNGASSQQEAGSLTGYFEVRGWTKSSGEPSSEDGKDESNTQRLDLYLSWTPIDRATFTIDVPWVFNAIDNATLDEKSHSTLNGIGDVSLAASVLLWRNRPALPSTWVELRGFLKTPTGRSGEEVNGEQDPHLQPGAPVPGTSASASRAAISSNGGRSTAVCSSAGTISAGSATSTATRCS